MRPVFCTTHEPGVWMQKVLNKFDDAFQERLARQRGAAVPTARIGPVGRPVGEPDCGSSVTSNS